MERLEDIIDLPALQRLMDLFHAATSIPVGIIDTKGNILVATGWKDICNRFHRLHPVTAARCRESDDYIKSHLHNGDYVQYKCGNGLWDIACPLVIAGSHVATLFLGQFFYDDEIIDHDFFRRLRMECGFDADDYHSALRQVPVMTRRRVADIMAYYSNFVRFLTASGVTRMRQVEAEQSLRLSEERFRTLFENSSDTIAVINPEGTIRFVSPSVKHLLRHHPHEMEGMNIFDLVHEEDIPLATATLAALLDDHGGSRRITTRLKARDGTWRVCETVARNLLDDPAVAGLIFNVRDDTERHRAEAALKKSQEMFSRIFNTAPIPISISTLDDGRFLEVNEAFERLTGYRREEVIGRVATSLPIWYDPSERNRLLALLKEQGEVHNFEFVTIEKGGRRLTGLLAACVVGLNGEKCVIMLNCDVTELKEAEESLKKSEEKFSRAFNTAPIPLAITRAADGIYLEVNDCFELITGWKKEEIVGRSAITLGLLHDPAEREAIMAVLEEKGEINNYGFTIRSKAGALRSAVLSACFIDLHGEKCVISMADDITERKLAEEEIEALNLRLVSRAAELEAANRDLEAFGYSLSHDLKNPLTRISISAQELRHEYAERLDETGQIFINSIHAASQKMGELIDSMLDLSRSARKDLECADVDLGELARTAVMELQIMEPERRVEFALEGNIVAWGDTVLLKAALENLIGNAWKYTGMVADARIEFGAATRDGEKLYFVRDNGAGFSMEEVDKLFQPFQRLHMGNEFRGSGIGLATVQRIIHRHGGRIWAEGIRGKGAAFYFTLPAEKPRG